MSTRNHLNISVVRAALSDEAFADRVSKNFLGDIKQDLSLELHDLSKTGEAEALALVLHCEESHLVFRVDRQSLGHLADSLNEVLAKGESESVARAA